VSEIQDIHHPENQGQPRGQKEKDHPVNEPMQNLDRQHIHDLHATSSAYSEIPKNLRSPKILMVP
jgi:hypothetical protein